MITEIREALINKYHLNTAYIETMIELIRQRIGIKSDIKKESIEMRGLSAILQLADERNLVIDMKDSNQLMLLVDIASWQYQSTTKISRFDGTSNPTMPADLRYRLNNMFVNGVQSNDI